MADEMELVGGSVESSGGAYGDVAPLESQDDAQRQPEKVQDFSGLDLTQLPQFREYQSRTDQRMTQLQREAEQARREAIEARMAGMDDFERVQYERDQYKLQFEGIVQQVETERGMAQALQYREQQLRELSQETGVPVDKLDKSSPEAALRSALSYLRQQQTQQRSAPPEPMEPVARANTVDLGGGSPQTADARQRAQLNNLRKQQAPATDIYKLLLRGG